jgi:predicted DNA-binding ArsR family transcriptional regulator
MSVLKDIADKAKEKLKAAGEDIKEAAERVEKLIEEGYEKVADSTIAKDVEKTLEEAITKTEKAIGIISDETPPDPPPSPAPPTPAPAPAVPEEKKP